MIEERIQEWLTQNCKDGIVPAEAFSKLLESYGLSYDTIVPACKDWGIIWEKDGYLYYRMWPVSKPRVELSICQTSQGEPYELAVRISRELGLDESPVEALKGLQNRAMAFLKQTEPTDMLASAAAKPDVTKESSNQASEETTQPQDPKTVLEAFEWKPGKCPGRTWVKKDQVPRDVLAKLSEERYVRFGDFRYRIEGDFVSSFTHYHNASP